MRRYANLSGFIKILVLSLVLSVFLQASNTYASNISTISQLLAINGDVNYVLINDLDLATGDADNTIEDIQLADIVTIGSPSYISNGFTGTFNGAGFSISGLTKPLFDAIGGDGESAEVSNLTLIADEDGVSGRGLLANDTYIGTIIENVHGIGDVDGGGSASVGGLVGTLGTGEISESSFTGDVTGTSYHIGGLVGESYGAISNSYATSDVTGLSQIGGLVGLQYDGDISNSYATGNVTGINDVGGLVGLQYDGDISNSYAAGGVGGVGDVGGLVGESYGTINNSYATGNVTGIDVVGGLVGDLSGTIDNSYATGDVEGTDYVGGLVGFSDGDINIESYATGNVTGLSQIGGLVGFSLGTFDENSHDENGGFNRIGPVRDLLSIVNTPLYELAPAFAVDSRINLGRPYLISLIDSYDVEESSSYRLRSYYTQAEKSLDKALTSIGFKSNFSDHPNLGFQALEQNQSNLPAVIQLFEVFEYQNSNILLSKEDGLQLSISSYYKKPVEIWTQGLDGEYLYLGLVEFDKDGKAILPTLKFDTANTYQLLMIKAEDKLSQKPNLEAKVGQITISVF
jgi:hypothetical protein